jgi:hypothetical protein
MIEVFGTDIWTLGTPVVVTTNGDVNRNGECVMGRGIALEAKTRYPGFAKLVADHIKRNGNVVGYFCKQGILTLPVKHHWSEKADLDLIAEGILALCDLVDLYRFEYVYMVRPGCGNGHLSWGEVRPMIEWLDDRYVIVERNRQ